MVVGKLGADGKSEIIFGSRGVSDDWGKNDVFQCLFIFCFVTGWVGVCLCVYCFVLTGDTVCSFDDVKVQPRFST